MMKFRKFWDHCCYSQAVSAGLFMLVFALVVWLAFLSLLMRAHCLEISYPGPDHREFRVGQPHSKGVMRWDDSYCVSGELLVSFRDNVDASRVRKLKESLGVLFSKRPPFADFEKIRVEDKRMREAVSVLRQSPLVRYAEPNYLRKISSWVPNDPLFDKQWNFKEPSEKGGIGMPDAWTKAPGGGSGVAVAVIDTGVAYRTQGIYRKAPDLAGTKFKEGYDFVNEDPYPDDDNGHGTHICGTIAQTTNNGYGVAGAAFGAIIIPVKSFDRTGWGIDEDIARGIRFAVQKGARVINLSFGGEGSSAVLESAIDYALSRGAVVCASSGNDNEDKIDYPAAYKECIAVGATNRERRRASYSNYGAGLDVVAPGGEAVAGGMIIQNTYVTQGDPTSEFGFLGMAGTSMATAHVSAITALIKSKNPSWSPGKIRSALISSCRDLGTKGWDPEYGYGLVDASIALDVATPPEPTTLAISSVFPDTVKKGERKKKIRIRGKGFLSPIDVQLKRVGEETIRGTAVNVVSSNEVECYFDFSGAQPGLYDLVLTRSSGTSVSLKGGIFVNVPASREWFFAEGCTAYGFEEYILFANPSDEQAFVSVTFMTPAGAKDPYPIIVPPKSRKTLRVNDVLPDSEVSLRVEANREIFCERSMYWNQMIEGTGSPGIQAPSYSWFFAEGCTAYGFETFILVQNPGNLPAVVEMTFMTPAGSVKKDAYRVEPLSRYTVNVFDEVPLSDVSVSVRADRRIVAERSMYWDSRRGGHCSQGTNGTCQKWYLAEGSTGWGFDEYVLVANPSVPAASVEFRYAVSSGSKTLAKVSVPGGSRFTLFLNEFIPEGDLGLEVSSDRGIVVERAMYWRSGSGRAGHCSLASPRLSKNWYLAEGSTAWGFETWLLVLNPGEKKGGLTLRFFPEGGSPSVSETIVYSSARLTVNVSNHIQDRDLSVEIISDTPVVVERAMYWKQRSGGHISFGVFR